MPESIRGVGCVLAVAGCVGLMPDSSHAQTTRLIMEASVDGAQTWSSEVTPTAGGTVYFRLRAQLVGATALGFSGMTLQPYVSNFVQGADQPVPFTFPGVDNAGQLTTETEYGGRQVAALPVTNTGRIFPFGAPPQIGLFVPGFHADGGNVLRIADLKATTPTLNTAWGVAMQQLQPSIMGTLFDGSLDVVVFRFAVTLASVDRVREAWPAWDGTISGSLIRWHTRADGTEPLNSTTIEQVPARVIPAPEAFGLLGVTAAVGLRRRR